MASCQGVSVTRAVSMDHEGKPHIKSRPVLRDLLGELRSFIEWQSLMINMGVEKFENDKIEKNHPSDIDRQKQEAFDKWLRMKPDACWKDVIDALYKMEEITLASRLAKQYAWKDPRKFVNWSFLSASYCARITATEIGDIPCRRFLPGLHCGSEYYTLRDESIQPKMNERSAAVRTNLFSHLLQNRPCTESLAKFFRSIECSSSKGDFKVGLEARFGHVYLKMNPKESVNHANSARSKREWIRSKMLRNTTFNTEVEEADVEQLFIGRKLLCKELTRITLKFRVKGKDEGTYSAAIATYEDDDVFYLDAVYRDTDTKNKARLNIALPGLKYDLRMSECSDCILLAEHQTSNPYQMAQTITCALRRLPCRKLRVILHGLSLNKKSSWKVKYIRQRVQKQYEWKPEKKWILVRYDVDVLDFDTKQAGDSMPLPEGVDIEFDYSRKEVELWGQNKFPKNVGETHLSRGKYYYMEGIEGVRLPGGELRDPYDWTTEELLRDFEEFLGDAFKIAHILDGSPY